MKPELKNKLKVYASLTSCVLLSKEVLALASPSYTYINLDCTESNSYYNGYPNNTIPDYLIDVDNDGVDDFRLVNNRSNNGPWGTCFDNSFKIYGLGNNRIVGNSGFVSNLPASYSINSSLNFVTNALLISSTGCGYASWCYSCYTPFYNKFGNWTDDKEMGYIAIKGDYGYGWMRLGVYNYNSWAGVVLVDYEFNTNITPQIKSALHECPTVAAYDISDNKDGSDLWIQSNKQFYDVVNCYEYRFFIVKEENASTFDINQAEVNTNYISKPAGTHLYFSADATTKDADGDLIVENQPYKVFVLSIADGIIATENVLSCPSETITLTSPAVASSTASSIVAQDISNNGDATDLKVNFNKASDETTVDEYRAFVVKDGTSFSLTDAEANSNYKSVSPSGFSQYTLNYLATDTDTNGDIIVEDIWYKVYVMSVADGVNANANSLSSASNQITLTTPIIASSAASNIVASDIDNNKNATDLHVEFSKASDENTLSEYRVFVCKYSNTFNINDAENNSNYTLVTKAGSSKYTATFLETTLDTDGDLIIEDVWYKIYVMSVADGVNANANNLSNPSNNVKLTSPLSVKENTKNFGAFYNNNQLNINVDNTLVGADIEVVNLLGEKVLSNKLDNSNNQFALNVANGMYVVIIRKDGAVMTKKVVVN